MRFLRSTLRVLGAGTVIVLVALGVWALLPAATAPIAGEHSIAAIERIELGGVRQTILLRGHDTRNPLLLYLHGGPGGAHMPLAPFYAKELEKHFVVVHWDQRGAGSSCEGVDPATLSLERITADAIELAEHLTNRFGTPLVLLGHSWGSLVGVRAVEARPDSFAAYVSVGQLVNLRRNEELAHAWVLAEAKRRGDAEALAALERIGLPPYASQDDLGVQRRYLLRWGGSIHDLDAAREALPRFFFGREYTLRTRLRFMRCFNTSLARIWDTIQDVDLMSEARALDVPVFVLIGREDYNTPFELTEAWAMQLEAPSVDVTWFDGVGHMLPLENPAAFQRTLIEKVLPAVRDSAR